MRAWRRKLGLGAALVLAVGLLVGCGGGSASTGPTDTAAPISTQSATPAGARWVPALGNQPWQWELGHPLNLKSAADMGTGAKLPDGSPAPNPVIYDIDGIANPAATVATLHSAHDHVICYIEVGSAGDYYSTDEEGIPTTYYAQLKAAGLFGTKMSGFDESYIDIRSPKTLPIIESMIDRQCKAKGFDGIETDIDESYNSSSGFPLTKADEEAYMTTLANYMHGLDLAWIIKNPDDTGDSYAADMYPYADAVLTESCNEYNQCDLLNDYRGHKAVFNAEYTLATSTFCPSDNSAGFNGAKFSVDLDGQREPCR
jgi:hypothetical protein